MSYGFRKQMLLVVKVDDVASPVLDICRPDSPDWNKEWEEWGDCIKRMYKDYLSGLSSGEKLALSTIVSGEPNDIFPTIEEIGGSDPDFTGKLSTEERIREIRGTNWQSIDTAPKDGSRVFAWHEKWDVPGFVRWALNPRTNTEFWNDALEWDAYELEQEPPTHWLPLPHVPTVARVFTQGVVS